MKNDSILDSAKSITTYIIYYILFENPNHKNPIHYDKYIAGGIVRGVFEGGDGIDRIPGYTSPLALDLY